MTSSHSDQNNSGAFELSEASNHVLNILTASFLQNYPQDAARKLESLPEEEAAALLESVDEYIRHRVWRHVSVAALSLILPALKDAFAPSLLESMEAGPCASLLAQLTPELRIHYMSMLRPAVSDELKELMDYPLNSAGQLMDTRFISLDEGHTVNEVLEQLPRFPAFLRKRIYLVDADRRLKSYVDLEHLVFADPNLTLKELGQPVKHTINALDPKEDINNIVSKNALDALPVIDIHHRLLGVIRGNSAIDTIKEDISGDLQAMVGASRDELALSSSFFAVKKRQPWLQINLLTGFLAAAVVGLFESTIAQFTALAILMPVAAGQSGNTGAQALAVTMRGLTLREITTRHWLQTGIKEAGAGFMNGLAIAITCGVGVWIWSHSFGLALVIALAMIISMTIAGISGAWVPIFLKKMGMDPAQSSSIILTTVTDIAGFMSFLGIATALSSMLH